MHNERQNEILRRLAAGQSLEGLGLAVRDGRIDLSNLTAPEPTLGKTVRLDIADVTQLHGLIKIRDVTWRSLDFTGSKLPHLLFFDCRIEDCVLDKCYCREWKLWGTQVVNTSFRSTDLRTAVLGGTDGGKRNSYHHVDFTRADLRGTVYTSAEFVACTFRDTKLDKVDFKWSTFADCTFEGELNEVLFYRKSFSPEEARNFPPNDMSGVDFSRARLRWTEFRGLDLDTVRFPEDDEHIVVNDYPLALDRVLKAVEGRTDIGARSIAAVFANKRKWAGPNQRRGVLNKHDIVEMAGQDGLDMVLELLKSQVL